MLFVSLSVFITFLPLYYQDRGLSNTQVGAVMGIGSLVAIFAQPLWGIVSDKRKTVKKMILLFIVITAALSAWLFEVRHVELLMFVMIVFSVFHTALPALTDSLSVSAAVKYKRSYGFFRLWGDVGIGAGALGIGALIAFLGMDRLSWIYIGALAICFCFALRIEDAPAKPVQLDRQSFLRLFRNPSLIRVLLIALLFSLPHRMNDALLGIYMSSLGANESQVGQAWTVATFSSIPAFLVTGYILRKWNEWATLAVVGVLYAGRWLLVGLAPDPGIVVILQALQGITFPVFFVTIVQLVTRIVPSELRTTGQTTLAAVFGGIAGMTGSAGGGWIMDHFSPSAAYLFAALFSLVAALAAFAARIREARAGASVGRREWHA